MQESTNLSVNYLPVFRHEQPELHFYLVACHRSVDRGRTQRREGRKGPSSTVERVLKGAVNILSFQLMLCLDLGVWLWVSHFPLETWFFYL